MTDEKTKENSVGLIFQHIARLRNRVFEKQVEPYGLTTAQVYAVNHLLDNDGLSQVELARLVGIGTVALSGLVDRMEAAGLVVRKPDPQDRRTKRVWLTDRMRDMRPQVLGAALKVNDASLEGFTAEEVDTLLDMLRRIRTNLTDRLEEPGQG